MQEGYPVSCPARLLPSRESGSTLRGVANVAPGAFEEASLDQCAEQLPNPLIGTRHQTIRALANAVNEMRSARFLAERNALNRDARLGVVPGAKVSLPSPLGGSLTSVIFLQTFDQGRASVYGIREGRVTSVVSYSEPREALEAAGVSDPG